MSQLYQLRQDMYDISSLNNRLKSFNHYLTYLPPLLLNTPLFFYVMPLLNTHNVFLPPPPPPLPPPVYYLSWLIVVLCRQNIIILRLFILSISLVGIKEMILIQLHIQDLINPSV